MNEIPKILCITDSLGLPRPGVSYEETWIYKLKRNLPNVDFITLFKRLQMTDCLLDHGDYLLYYKPNYIILQLGICDCAPRYIRTNSIMYKLINSLPNIFQNIFWKVYKNVFKRKEKRTNISLKQFEYNIRQYFSLCINHDVKKVYVIKIGIPSESATKKNPRIINNVNKYNAVYDELTKQYPNVVILNPLCMGDDKYYVDGYHCNNVGNTIVANCLSLQIKEEFDNV